MMGELMLARSKDNETQHRQQQQQQFVKLVMHGKYELGRVLGQGTFARVYYARHVESGKSVAMKVVGKEKVVRAKMMDQMKREISVMKKLKHPNIVELHEVMATKSKIFLAMELVRGGELHAKVSKEGKLDEGVARRYFKQLISAIDYCHSRGVFHRDLKLENLLLDHDDRVKVTDFGLSAFFEEEGGNQLLRTSCGTPHYVAPEVVSKKGLGYDGAKADIWSCGIILFVLMAGYLPFHDENIVQMYKKVYKGDFTCPTWFSAEARELVTRMLDPNAESRITVAEIMDCRWMNKDEDNVVGDIEEVNDKCFAKKEVEALNAFHIISMSEGLDLSPLFLEEKKKREEREEIGFTTVMSANEVVEKIEEMVQGLNGKFKVSKDGESVVRIQGQYKGRKGKLVIDVELFTVSSSFLMVEIKKESGDTLEFNMFCQNYLRPALVDIVWTTAAMAAAAAAASEPPTPTAAVAAAAASFNPPPPCAAAAVVF